MEPIKIKNETPEITAMRDELSDLLKRYSKGEISYNAYVGMGMKLALKILQEATNHNE